MIFVNGYMRIVCDLFMVVIMDIIEMRSKIMLSVEKLYDVGGRWFGI